MKIEEKYKKKAKSLLALTSRGYTIGERKKWISFVGEAQESIVQYGIWRMLLEMGIQKEYALIAHPSFDRELL